MRNLTTVFAVYGYISLSVAALSLSGFTSSAQAQTLETLHLFTDKPDGAYPYAGLIADGKGALYGTTYNGGTITYGTVFKLTPPVNGKGPWTQSVINSFCQSVSCIDGANPAANLVADPQGTLYGTTYKGGLHGYGAVFKLTPPGGSNGKTVWTETVPYNFTGGDDGAYPQAGLIWRQGSLYGTAYEGGTGCGIYGCGTVFKLTPPPNDHTRWTYTVIYRFPGGDAGAYPLAGLIADEKGALYGTTYNGGTIGVGTVFKLTPPANGESAWTETILHDFSGGPPDAPYGTYPKAGLIADKKGALYGTTYEGGGANLGTVFMLTPPASGEGAWTPTVLHAFTYSNDDFVLDGGAYPMAGVVADPQGALYGTTYEGGINCGSDADGNGCGTVFKLTPPAVGQIGWTKTVLHRFNGDDGAFPTGLIADPQGVLYGTTYEGGYVGTTLCHLNNGCGTVFKLTPGLGKGHASGQSAGTALTSTEN